MLLRKLELPYDPVILVCLIDSKLAPHTTVLIFRVEREKVILKDGLNKEKEKLPQGIA